MESRESPEFLRGHQRSRRGGGASHLKVLVSENQWSLWNECLGGYFSLAMTMLLALTSAQRVGYSSLLLQPKQPRQDFSDQIPPLMRTAEAVTALTLL